MRDLQTDVRGTASRWFALAAFVISAASLAGAHGLAWLSESGRVALVAVRSVPQQQTARAIADPNVDDMPTGAIKPGTALVLRLR